MEVSACIKRNQGIRDSQRMFVVGLPNVDAWMSGPHFKTWQTIQMKCQDLHCILYETYNKKYFKMLSAAVVICAKNHQLYPVLMTFT